MAQIVEIKNKEVLIGEDNGNLISVDIFALDFIPEVGQTVSVYRSEQGLVKVILETKKSDFEQDTLFSQSVNKRPVNRTVYLLLSFFFGYIGLHKFYAGFIGKGFLYLFFFWTFIPAIISFCTFVKAAMTPSDPNGFIYLNKNSSIVKYESI